MTGALKFAQDELLLPRLKIVIQPGSTKSAQNTDCLATPYPVHMVRIWGGPGTPGHCRHVGRLAMARTTLTIALIKTPPAQTDHSQTLSPFALPAPLVSLPYSLPISPTPSSLLGSHKSDKETDPINWDDLVKEEDSGSVSDAPDNEELTFRIRIAIERSRMDIDDSSSYVVFAASSSRSCRRNAAHARPSRSAPLQRGAERPPPLPLWR